MLKRKYIILLYRFLLIILSCLFVTSVYAGSQTRFVSVAASVAVGSGIVWDNTDSLFVEDAKFARLNSSIFAGGYSEFLDAHIGQNNEFYIPVDATINGIIVEVLSSDDIIASTSAGDSLIKIRKAGTPTGTDQKVEIDDWPDNAGGLQIKTWGSATNLWGTTWTYTDINDSLFGIRIQIVEQGGVASKVIIDYIKITVIYTPVFRHATETLFPESIIVNLWDSSGSGTKPQMLSDAVDANYTWSDELFTDRYEMSNMKADDDDVLSYDSVRIYSRIQDNNIGTNNVQFKIFVDGTGASGAILGTTSSWVDKIDGGFILTPGGIAWTRQDLDTIVLLTVVEQIDPSGEARVTSCSMVVFMTLEDPLYTLYYTNDDGFKSGANFGKEMRRDFENNNFDTLKIQVSAGVTANDYFSVAGIIRVDTWETGGFLVNFKVIRIVSTPELQIRVNAIKPTSKTVEESTPFTTAIAVDTIGNYTIRIPSHDWVTNSDSSLLELQFKWFNAIGQPVDSVYIPISVAENSFQHNLPLLFNVADASGDCLTTDTLFADATDATYEDWTAVGGTKQAVVSDGLDINYIFATVKDDIQGFRLEDNTIGADGIDQLFIQVRYKRTEGRRGRAKMTIYMDGGANECVTAHINTSSSETYFIFEMELLGLPDAVGICAGAFTLAGLDSLRIRVELNLISGNEFHVAEINMIVCYSSGQLLIRRRRLEQGT